MTVVRTFLPLLLVLGAAIITPVVASEAAGTRKETWDYAPTVKSISTKFIGAVGKAVPMGDSITYANQASTWARNGAGKTADEQAVGTWMHADKNDNSNGWWLAVNDQPDNRSWTAASGITSEDYINGGFHGLPSLADILAQHKPQIALILLGTNDLKREVSAAAYLSNMEKIYKACMEAGAVPVVTTVLPTTWAGADKIATYNDGLFKLAGQLKLPFLDLNGEFLKLQPGEGWKGTLISNDGAHPTYDGSEGPANEDNLKKCGYLLKCYLQCKKVGEIKLKMKW